MNLEKKNLLFSAYNVLALFNSKTKWAESLRDVTNILLKNSMYVLSPMMYNNKVYQIVAHKSGIVRLFEPGMLPELVCQPASLNTVILKNNMSEPTAVFPLSAETQGSCHKDVVGLSLLRVFKAQPLLHFE